MYYYIFDIKKCKKKSLVQDVKDYLSHLGISGEFTYPSAAYSIDELIDLGLSKKYNTIVGIGDDEVANKIATKLCGRQEAMGMIPLEATPDLHSLLDANSWKEAADNLRFRKIEELKIAKTASGGGFLTNVTLDITLPTEVTIEFKDFIAQAKVTNLMISIYNPEIKKIGPDYLDIVMQSVNQNEGSLFKKLSAIFGLSKSDNNLELSLFRARSLRLFTNSQINLVSGSYSVAKTPQLIESSDENLRLIVGKKG